MAMFNNHVLTAWRNVQRNPGIASINILGLAIGLVCVLCSLSYAIHQYGYDTQFTDSDNIYFLGVRYKQGIDFQYPPHEKIDQLRQSSEFFGRALFTGRSVAGSNALFRVADVLYSESVCFVSDNFFEIFDFDFLAGRADTAFSEPNSLVIAKSLADKLFPDTDAMNREIEFARGLIARVKGVFDDSGNSHLDRRIYLNPSSYKGIFGRDNPIFMALYGKSLSGFPSTGDDQKIIEFMNRGLPPDTIQTGGQVFVPGKVGGELIPIEQIQVSSPGLVLGAAGNQFVVSTGEMVGVLLFLSGVILAISLINYFNLSAAQLQRRLKEVALRKVTGATSYQILFQLIIQSFLVAVITAGIAILFFDAILIGAVNNWWLGGHIPGWAYPVLVLAFGVLVALVGGWASILSVSRGSLPGQFEPGPVSAKSRNVLLFFQFWAAGVLIIVVLFGQQQLNMLKALDRGYEADGVYILKVKGTIGNIAEEVRRIREVLLREDSVDSVSFSLTDPISNLPGSGLDLISVIGEESEKTVSLASVEADYSYLDVYRIKLVAGSDALLRQQPDVQGGASAGRTSQYIVITESAAKKLGFDNPEQAVGRALLCESTFLRNGRKVVPDKELTVVGVTEDVLFGNGARLTAADYFTLTGVRARTVSVRVNKAATGNMMEKLEEVWRRESSNSLASVDYLPELERRAFSSVTSTVQVFYLLSVMAIVIACLGLYAMSLFAAQCRTKEVGIRKVLGANITTIIVVLMRNFMVPVLLACVVAVPVGFITVNYLLQGFSIRIEPGPLWFFVGVLILLLIAGATVSIHTFRAARANPVKSLRYE